MVRDSCLGSGKGRGVGEAGPLVLSIHPEWTEPVRCKLREESRKLQDLRCDTPCPVRQSPSSLKGDVGGLNLLL